MIAWRRTAHSGCSSCATNAGVGVLRDRRRLQLAQRNHCLLARQRIWHAHAAFIGALAQGLLDERGRAAKEAAELVAARELPRLQLREHPHQQLSRERLQHCD